MPEARARETSGASPLGRWPPSPRSSRAARGLTRSYRENQLGRLINVALEELIRARRELPGFTALDKMVSAIRNATNAWLFELVVTRLDTADRRRLARLRWVDPTFNAAISTGSRWGSAGIREELPSGRVVPGQASFSAMAR